jgi:hypothetical protein
MQCMPPADDLHGVQVELITSVDISLAFSYDASARTAKIVNGGAGLPTRDLYILGSKATEYAACLGMQLQSPASFQGDLPATLDYALANGIAGFIKLSISLGAADPFDVMDRLDLPGWPSEIAVQSTTLTVDLDPRSGAVTYMQLRQVGLGAENGMHGRTGGRFVGQPIQSNKAVSTTVCRWQALQTSG